MKTVYNDYFIQLTELSIEIGTPGATMILPDPTTIPTSGAGVAYTVYAPNGGKVVSAKKSSQAVNYVGSSLNSGILASSSNVTVSNGLLKATANPATFHIRPVGLNASAPSFVHASVTILFDKFVGPFDHTMSLDNGAALTDTSDIKVNPLPNGKTQVTISITQICRSFGFSLNLQNTEIISQIKIDLFSLDNQLGVISLSAGDTAQFKTDNRQWFSSTTSGGGSGGGSGPSTVTIIPSLSDAYNLPPSQTAVGMQVFDQTTNRNNILVALPASDPNNWKPAGDGDVEDSFRPTNAAFDYDVATQKCNSDQTIVSASLPVIKKYKIVASSDMDVVFDLPVLGSSPMLVGNTWHLFAGDKLEFYKTIDGTMIDAEVR